MDFLSQNLNVDYLTLTMGNFKDRQDMVYYMARISRYLSDSFAINTWLTENFDDNNVFMDEAKLYSIPIVDRPTSQFKAFFVILDSKYTNGNEIKLSLRLCGQDAAHFYKCRKDRKIDWEKFKTPHYSISLSRFDLCYDREHRLTDILSIQDRTETVRMFMYECKDFIERTSTRKEVYVSESKTSGLILKIGNRSGRNYCRVYAKYNGLRFELEIKKETLSLYSQDFFNSIEQFESQMTCHYCKQFLNSLSLSSCYTDWLVENGRKLKKHPDVSNLVVSTYLAESDHKPKTPKDAEQFIIFLQLLSFIQDFDDVEEREDEFWVSFFLSDFRNYLEIEKENRYQISKITDYLKTMQKKQPILESFSGTSYESYLAFTSFKLDTVQGNIRLAVRKQFYKQFFPFYLPEFLYKSHGKYRKYDLVVKLVVIRSFCTQKIRKTLDIHAILDEFSVSNQRKTIIKRRIIDILQQFHQEKLIESNLYLISEVPTHTTIHQLNPRLITQARTIYYYERLIGSKMHFYENVYLD